MTSKIIATGSYVPNNPVDNDYLANLVETNDEWIRTRTGIETRYLSTGEGTTTLAYEAARDAIESADIAPLSIDYIIVATMSPDLYLPNTAAQVQTKLGAVNAACFDVNVACSGFIYALTIADSLLRSTNKKRALVIGAETLSRLLDWSDRSTCVLFGDGAGAVVLETSERGIIHSVLGSDGEKGDALLCRQPALNNPFIHTEEKRQYMTMDGHEVFKFAVTKVTNSIETLLKEAGKTKEEISGFYLHQANYRILEAIAKRLKVDSKKFPMNLQKYSNTSAATIPILLNECNRNQTLKEGDLIVLSGFGGGLTWGSMLLEW